MDFLLSSVLQDAAFEGTKLDRTVASMPSRDLAIAMKQRLVNATLKAAVEFCSALPTNLSLVLQREFAFDKPNSHVFSTFMGGLAVWSSTHDKTRARHSRVTRSNRSLGSNQLTDRTNEVIGIVEFVVHASKSDAGNLVEVRQVSQDNLTDLARRDLAIKARIDLFFDSLDTRFNL